MDAVGVGLSIPGVFTALLEILDRFSKYRDFKIDSEQAVKIFDSDKEKLRQWLQAKTQENISLNGNAKLLELALGVAETAQKLESILDSTRARLGTGDKIDQETTVSSKGKSNFMLFKRPKRLEKATRVQNAESSKKHKTIISATEWAAIRRRRFLDHVQMFHTNVEQIYDIAPISNLNTAKAEQERHSDEDEIDAAKLRDDITFIIEELKRKTEVQLLEDILSWLDIEETDRQYGISEYFENQSEQRLENTCEWIFDHPAYKSWDYSEDISDVAVYVHGAPGSHSDQHTDSTTAVNKDVVKAKILWIYGPPGFGKTILCTKIVEFQKKTTDRLIAFFLASPHAKSGGNPHYIVKYWLAQLINSDQQILEIVRNEYNKIISSKDATGFNVSKIKPENIWNVLMRVLDERKNCLLVIDGLDEYKRGEDARIIFLNRLKSCVSFTHTRVVVLSRDEVDIRTCLDSEMNNRKGLLLYACKITQSTATKDISLYARSIVDDKLQAKSEELKDELVERLQERCGGMFLLLKLQRDRLRSGKNQKQLLRAVDAMPQDLSAAYERNLELIKNKEPEDHLRAIIILKLILAAGQSLTVSQIVASVAICLADKTEEFPLDEMSDVLDADYVNGDIVDLCASLVEVRQSSGDATDFGNAVVQTIHPSVDDFVLKMLYSDETIPLSINYNFNTDSMSVLRLELGRLCVASMRFPNAWRKTKLDYPQSMECALVPYAAMVWVQLLRTAKNLPSHVEKELQLFLDDDCQSFCEWSSAEVAQGKSFNSVFEESPLAPSAVLYAAAYKFLSNSEDFWKKHIGRVNECAFPKSSAFHWVCYHGNLPLVKLLLQLGADPNAVDKSENSSLHYAIIGGNREVAEELVRNGADTFLTNNMGRTALFLASEMGFHELVSFLLNWVQGLSSDDAVFSSGATNHKCESIFLDTELSERSSHIPVEASKIISTNRDLPLVLSDSKLSKLLNMGDNNKEIPIQIAAKNGHVETFELLFNVMGHDINIGCKDGQSPCHYAARNGCIDIVKMYNEIGALNIKNDMGGSALHYAAEGGFASVATYLIDHGCNMNTTEMIYGVTPLHIAAYCGQLQIAKILVEHGCDKDKLDLEGNSALHIAIIRGHNNVAKYLLEQDCDSKKIRKNGGPCLIDTATMGLSEIVLMLIGRGHNIFATSDEGYTAFSGSVLNNHADIAEMLIERGHDVNSVLWNGVSPILATARSGYVPLVELLLRWNCDVTAVNQNGENAIHLAVQGDHLDTVRILSRGGVDVNCTRNDGRAPLHIAAERGNIQIIEALLECNADIHKRTVSFFGVTALLSAASSGYIDSCRVLIKRGANILDLDAHHSTVFALASFNGDLDMIKYLVDEGWLSACTESRKFSCPCRHPDILAASCATVQHALEFQDTSALSALHKAFWSGSLNTARYLIENFGLDMNARGAVGSSTLHFDCLSNDVECVNFALAKGQNPAEHHNFGLSALDLACARSSLEIVQRLLGANKVEESVRPIWTPLHWACRSGSIKKIRFLLDMGFEPSLVSTSDPVEAWSPADIGRYYCTKLFTELPENEEAEDILRRCELINYNITRIEQCTWFNNFQSSLNPFKARDIYCDSCYLDMLGRGYECRTCSDFHLCWICMESGGDAHSCKTWDSFVMDKRSTTNGKMLSDKELEDMSYIV